jgi:hypothetical protein
MTYNKTGWLILTFFTLLISKSIRAEDSETSSHSVILKLESVALLGIATGDVSLVIEGATEAGAPITTVTEDESTRLRITSLAEEGKDRLITAKISKELSGSELLVQAKPASTANFVGEPGTYADPVVLTTTDQNVILDIGTCWSGTGEEDGYVIKYLFRLASTIDGEPYEENTTVVVTFTLSDES